MANSHNQLIIEKVENGFIIAIQGKTKKGGFLSGLNEIQEDKKYLVAKDIPEVQKLLKDYLGKLITANESRKILEDQETEDDEDEDE